MNVVKEIGRICEQEMSVGIFGGITKGSWHEKYKESAWVFIGGFSYELSERDLICVMSQWGEIADINLVREKATNKSMGFGFVKYEDQRSTILAVDNFNGVALLGRTLRCDHVEKYKLPKEVREKVRVLLDELNVFPVET
jgi:RNA-binding motif X-linked protein 2